MTSEVNPLFVRGVTANLAYWQKELNRLAEATIYELEVEQPNLLHAAQLGLVLPKTRRDVASLILLAFPLIERTGYWQVWMPLIEQSVSYCSHENWLLKFRLMLRWGQFLRFNRQLDQAISVHEDAKVMAQQSNDHNAIVDIYFQLSADYRLKRVYIKAEDYSLKALEIAQKMVTGNEKVATILNTFSLIAAEQGQFDVAEQRLHRAITLWQGIGKPIELARTLNSLAVVLQEKGNLNEALATYNEAATLLDDTTTSAFDKVRVQLSLGSLYFKLADWERAEAVFRYVRSLLIQQPKHLFLRAVVNHNLGNTLLKRKSYQEAEIYLRRSLALWSRIEDDIAKANTIGALGELLGVQGKITEAVAFYDDALHLLEKYPTEHRARRLLDEFTTERNLLGNDVS